MKEIFTPYTEEEDEFVHAGVANGLSLREMGDAIGRTRNSIVNRIRVLGIVRPVAAADITDEGKTPELASAPIKLIDTGADVCHWPLWQENGAPDFLVCGAPGYPYCAKHRRVATSTPRSLTSLTSLEG